MNSIISKIRNSDVNVIPEVALERMGKYNAFDVKAVCNPAFAGTDRDLMNEICQLLTTLVEGKIELKTFYVVHDAHFDSKHRIEEILFQVITPLEPQWYC